MRPSPTPAWVDQEHAAGRPPECEPLATTGDVRKLNDDLLRAVTSAALITMFAGCVRDVAYSHAGDVYELQCLERSVQLTRRDGSGLPGWEPLYSPDGRWIAFVERDTPTLDPASWTEELVVINRRGGERVSLTSDVRPLVVRIGPFDWAPNSDDLVFTAVGTSPRPSTTIWKVSRTGGPASARVLFIRPGFDLNTQPDWSPDGRRIVMVSTADGPGTSEIVTTNADGTNLTRLASFSDEVYAHAPTWSPDGRLIVFGVLPRRRPGSADPSQLGTFVMNSDGSDIRRVFEDPAHAAESYEWSPDGNLLAFPCAPDMCVLNHAARDRFTLRLRIPGISEFGYQLGSFSPGGQRLIFNDYVASPTRQGIHVLNVRSGERRRLPVLGSRPHWRPGGILRVCL